MKDYQYRVLQERIELESKLEKLRAFIRRPDFKEKVSIGERIRLISQQQYMTSYLSCLCERIKHFNEPEDLQ